MIQYRNETDIRTDRQTDTGPWRKPRLHSTAWQKVVDRPRRESSIREWFVRRQESFRCGQWASTERWQRALIGLDTRCTRCVDTMALLYDDMIWLARLYRHTDTTIHQLMSSLPRDAALLHSAVYATTILSVRPLVYCVKTTRTIIEPLLHSPATTGDRRWGIST